MTHINPFSLFGTVIATVGWVGASYLYEPPFIAIKELSQVGEYVTMDRAIRGPDTAADWAVSVFDSTGDKVCDGGGRDEYSTSEARRKTWHVDVFTGDDDCWDRVPVGESTAYIMWHPLDGRPPVFKTLIVKKGADND